MGRSRSEKAKHRSQTLPSSPSHSSSSSDFEFTICSSPRNNSSATADDLFYKGKLLPLHLSPRLSMLRTLLLASDTSTSSSSSDTATTSAASRDSSGSNSSSDAVLFADYNCDSSRPSSVADLEDEYLKRPLNAESGCSNDLKKSSKYFSLARISSVFKKEPRTTTAMTTSSVELTNNGVGTAASSGKKTMSASARDVFKKYIKKVKPLYEKLSQTQKQIKIESSTRLVNPSDPKSDMPRSIKDESQSTIQAHSFSGNLWYPNYKKKGAVSSCPSSMRSSPRHSGVLTRTGLPHPIRTCSANGAGRGGDSSMEELQSAIQGAIAHCKNSMLAAESRT